MNRRRVALTAAVGAAILLVSGCGYKDVYSLPLPGGVGGGSGSYTVSVNFADAGNLVPRESCRSNDVPIGTITSISVTPDLRAHVVCKISGSVHLPANTTATIATTSLLGEAYVALGPPPGVAPQGELAHGTQVADTDSHTDPDVEEILGSLSAILNNGDIADLQDITQELNNALSGRESDVRALLSDLRTFTGRLNHHRTEITAALNGLNHLGSTLAAQRKTLGQALDSIPAGVRVLNDERPALIQALHQLSSLSKVGTRVINASRANTVADLKLLKPTIAGLAKDGGEIASALELIPDFPFPRNSLAGIKGDYAGFYADVNFSLDAFNKELQQQAAAAHTRAKQHGRSPLEGKHQPTTVAGKVLKLLGELLGITHEAKRHLPKALSKIIGGLDAAVGGLTK